MRTTRRHVVAGFALLLAGATAQAQPISIVVSGQIEQVGGYPNSFYADNEFWVDSTESDYIALALPWNQTPATVGDEVRVLLSFDPAATSVSPALCSGGYSTRGYGPATGSISVAGIAAVLTSGSNSVAAGRCGGAQPFEAFVVQSDVAGPSLTTSIDLPTDGLESEHIAAEMPIRGLSIFLSSSASALCVGSDGSIPLTTAEFVANCGNDSSAYSELILGWQSDIFCISYSCRANAAFRIHVSNLTVSAPTNNDFVDQLVAEVLVLNLNQGIENSLDAKIADAVGASDNIALAQFATTTAQKSSANSAAKNKLGAFINEVNAQRGKAIPDVKATRLITLANNLAARL